MYYRTGYDSPVGPLMLASDGTSLTGLWMEGQKYFGGAIREELVQRDDLPVFAMTRTWLERYFARERPDPSELPLAPRGGEFRQAVWELLCQIPYGELTTWRKRWRLAWAEPPCRPRQWAARWGIIPSPSSFPATGWWGATAA